MGEAEAKKLKKAVAEFDRATRPVVRQVIDLANKSVIQAGNALQVAQANVDRIADAAVNVGAAQADVAAADASKPGPRKRGPR